MARQIHIRRALQSDANDIARVHVEATRAAYKGIYTDKHLESLSIERMAANWLHVTKGHLMRSDCTVFVALDDEKVIGFADIGGSAGEFLAELYAIYLNPAYIRRGIGSRLFQECLDCAKRRGFRSMKLTVLSANHAARAFYERMQGRVLPDTETEAIAGGTKVRIIVYSWPDLQSS